MGNLFKSMGHFVRRASILSKATPEQTQMLFEALPPVIAGMLLLNVVIAISSWQVIPVSHFTTWIFCSLAVEFAKFALLLKYKKSGQAARAPLPWFRLLTICVLVQGALIGASIWTIYPTGVEPQAKFLLTVIVGATAAIMMSLTAHLALSTYFVVAVLGPLALKLFQSPDFSPLFGWMTIVFAVMLINGARHFSWHIARTAEYFAEKEKIIALQNDAERSLRKTEERYSLAMKNSDAVAWDWDIESNQLHISDYAAKTLGLLGDLPIAPAEWIKFIHPDDVANYLKAVDDHLRGITEIYQCDFRVRHISGKYRFISDRGGALRNEQGNVYRMLGTARDVTEHRRNERMLREAVDSLSEGFALYDERDELVLMNEKYRQLYSTAFAEIQIGQSFEEIMRDYVRQAHPELDAAGQSKWVQKRLHEHHHPTESTEVNLRNGKWLRIDEIITESGYRGGLRVDITAEKEAAERARQNEDRFRDFAQSYSDRFWETNKEHQLVWAEGQNIGGIDRNLEFAIGRTRWVLAGLSPPYNEKWTQHIDDMNNHRPFREFEYGHVSEIGEDYFWSVKGVPYFDDLGEFVGYRGTAKNITARNLAEKTIRASEERFRAVAEYMATPMTISRQTDHVVISTNNACARVEDKELEQILNNPTFDDWRDESHFEYFLEQLNEFGRIENFEVQRQDRNTGAYRWILISAATITYENEPCILSTYADVTRHREAEEFLRQSEARMTGMLAIASEAIVTVGQDMKITIFNRGAEEVFGYSAEEALGQPLEILLPERFRGDHKVLVEAFAAREEASRFMDTRQEAYGLRKNGEEFPIEASISKLKFGNDILFTVMLHDISERKTAEIKLRRAKEEAERANRTKSEFLANMSHELRTPLNAVLGFSEAMQMGLAGEINEKQDDYISSIRQSGEYLLSLINDILDLSKLEADKEEIYESEINVHNLAKQVLIFVQERAFEKDITINMKLSSELPFLRVDERMMKQMLINLLSNAVKFTHNKGRVIIDGGMSTTGQMTITVSDNGKGIRQEDIPVALSPFGQIDNILQRDHQGSGLGLPLVKSQIELHAGSITIESEPGVGTTVGLHFPSERVVTTQI